MLRFGTFQQLKLALVMLRISCSLHSENLVVFIVDIMHMHPRRETRKMRTLVNQSAYQLLSLFTVPSYAKFSFGLG